jgi:hypothetical protein
MGTPLYNVTGFISPNDENSFGLRIETDNLKLIKDSIKKYRIMRNNVELLETKYFLEAVDEYPDTFLIIDIDPIVFGDKKNLYFTTLYCYGNDELDSKMDMLKRFFENFYGRRN